LPGTDKVADDQAPRFEVVAEAEDGVEAVTVIRRLRPDVAVMDLHMHQATPLD
jgi:chemotaxis response regulator CheB